MTKEIALQKAAEKETLLNIILFCESRIAAYEKGQQRKFRLELEKADVNHIDPKAFSLLSPMTATDWALQDVIWYCEEKIEAIDKHIESEKANEQNRLGRRKG